MSILKTSLALCLAACVGQAFAGDGTITINGKVINSTCTLAADGGPVQGANGNVVVTLPTVKSADFTSAPLPLETTNFQLKLVDTDTGSTCGSLSGITGVLISASTDKYEASETTALKNTKAIDAGATGELVHVRVLNENDVAINFQNPETINHEDGVIKLAAQYYGLVEDIAPQNVSAQVDYTIQYN